MRYPNIKELEKFIEKVDKYLFDRKNQIEVLYPVSEISPWDPQGITIVNENLLKNLSHKASVYAIFTAKENSEEYHLRYIGKSTKKLVRQRIRNHLIKKHKDTGAKLPQVIEHVKNKGKVKISWVGIEPESLRNFVEEELIQRHKESSWNRENQ